MPEYLALYVILENHTNSWNQMFPDKWTRRQYFETDSFDEVRELAREFRHFIEHPAGLVSPATILEKIKESDQGKPIYRIVQTGQSLSNVDLNKVEFTGLNIEHASLARQ